jgi:hypothetical protein
VTQLNATQFVTDHLILDRMIDAYDVYARAPATGSLKVAPNRSP